ncbi:MAG: glycosyltransferase [Gemmatimonadetes bacterium]|nr:glycosyltransferase [Gemmatimonadota bacterium]
MGWAAKGPVRILFAVPYSVWPPTGGARTRTAHLIEGLARHFEIHLFTLRGPDDPPDAPREHALCAAIEVATALDPNPRRFSLAWLALRLRSVRHPAPAYYTRRARRAFAALAARLRPELVVLGFSWMLPYGAAAGDAPIVADQHNYDPLLARRRAAATRGIARLKWRAYHLLAARAERRNLRRVRAIAAVSREEAALFARVAPHAEVAIVPNGVDTAYFRPSPLGRAVLFTASMSYAPNREAAEWLVREVWPAVRREEPGAQLRLVGWRGETALAHLRGAPGVAVVGSVPDVRPELEGAAVAVAPLAAGAGTRIKILEALAAGRPVVTTTVGAEGISVADGVHCLVRDDPRSFAEAVVRLLRDRELATRLAGRGRALVEERYTWEQAAEAFRGLCERTARRRSA